MSNARASRPPVPAPMLPAYEALLVHLDGVASSHVPKKIVPLLREAAFVLARKRPSPLLRGDSASWACGITLAISAENGLFEPRRRRPPRLSAVELARALGVAPSTGAAKAREARRHLKIVSPAIPKPDLRWCLPAVRAERQRAQEDAWRSPVVNPPASRAPRAPAPARAPARRRAS